MIGNTLFGDPNDPSGWLFGMPSIWTWQIVMWAAGAVLMWFLAYRVGLSTTPEHSIQPFAEDIAETPRSTRSGFSSLRKKSPSPDPEGGLIAQVE